MYEHSLWEGGGRLGREPPWGRGVRVGSPLRPPAAWGPHHLHTLSVAKSKGKVGVTLFSNLRHQNCIHIEYVQTSLVAQAVKHLSTMQETWIRSLGWEDSLEKEMAIHSSIVAWKIPWTEDRPQSMGSQRVRHDCVTFLYLSPEKPVYRTRSNSKNQT